MNFAVREILSLVLYRRQSFLFPKKRKKGGIRKHCRREEEQRKGHKGRWSNSVSRRNFSFGEGKRKKERKGDLHARRKSTKSRKTKTWIPFREERIIRGRAAESPPPREIHEGGAGGVFEKYSIVWEIYLTRLDEEEVAWRGFCRGVKKKKKEAAWRTWKWRPRRELNARKIVGVLWEEVEREGLSSPTEFS